MNENNQIPNSDIRFTYIKPRSFMTAPWVTNDECFTKEEIDTLNRSLEKYRQGYHDAKVGKTSTSSGGTENSVQNGNIRRTQVAFLNYADEDPILVDFFTKICALVDEVNTINFGFSLTGIQALQLGRYQAEDGGHYDWHQDCGFFQNATNNIRKLSFSLLLSEPDKDFEGGELEFKTDATDTRPVLQKGSIAFFPSPTLHRVKPVTKGLRESIVGWVSGPSWK